LIDIRETDGKGGHGRARAAAAACDHLYQNLSRWVGRDGCHALFTRALAEAQVEHGVLEQIKLRPLSQPYLDGVPETIMAGGDGETADALESMLVHLIELLVRLLGDDMATKLVERSMGTPGRGETMQEEA